MSIFKKIHSLFYFDHTKIAVGKLDFFSNKNIMNESETLLFLTLHLNKKIYHITYNLNRNNIELSIEDKANFIWDKSKYFITDNFYNTLKIIDKNLNRLTLQFPESFKKYESTYLFERIEQKLQLCNTLQEDLIIIQRQSIDNSINNFLQDKLAKEQSDLHKKIIQNGKNLNNKSSNENSNIINSDSNSNNTITSNLNSEIKTKTRKI